MRIRNQTKKSEAPKHQYAYNNTQRALFHSQLDKKLALSLVEALRPWCELVLCASSTGYHGKLFFAIKVTM